MGRNKIWQNPKKLTFILEMPNYETLLEHMKRDSVKEFQTYMEKIIQIVLGGDWKDATG